MTVARSHQEFNIEDQRGKMNNNGHSGYSIIKSMQVYSGFFLRFYGKVGQSF